MLHAPAPSWTIGELAPGGRLFMGHSETLNQACELFRLEGLTAYGTLRDSGTPDRVA